MSQQHRNVIAINTPTLDHTTNGEIRVYWMTVRGLFCVVNQILFVTLPSSTLD